MTIKQLNLLFPQWQGSGPVNELYYAATVLARSFTGIQFTPVSVLETESLEMEKGILGYNSILTQMISAADIVTHAAPDVILNLGGDCGIEPVPVSYLNHKHQGKFTLIWLDAHADLNTPESSPSGHFHGMPLATLLGLGDATLCNTCFSCLNPEQIILAGTRNFDPAESGLIRSRSITRLSAEDMETDPKALTRVVEAKGNHPVYIHIDMDVLDPDIFPCIRHPEPGGITPESLSDTLDYLKKNGSITGLGLMEFTLGDFEHNVDRNTETDRAVKKSLEIVKSLLFKSCEPDFFVSNK